MQILLIGLGSIGRRHLQNIKSIYPDAQINLLRHFKSVENETVPGVNQIFYKLTDAINAKPDVAFLTNPSPLHIPIALELADHGIHLFIEKPLSNDLNDVDELLRKCKNNDIILMVGYNLRFKNSLQVLKEAISSDLIGQILSYRSEVGQYLPQWRTGADYINSVSAKKELGGGVLLELSHEIDYARWLLGEPDSLFAISGKYGELTIDVEDCAEILVQFKSGVIGNIHMDMVNHAKTRKCQLIGTKGTLICDLIENSVKVFTEKSSDWHYLCQPQQIDANQTYLDEIKHFFNCIEERREPAVTINDGIAIQKIIEAVRESSFEKKWIEL